MHESVELILYIRKDCHLCTDMISELNVLQKKYFFCIKLVDIDSDVRLIERYGEFIPVLMGENEKICHFYLDTEALDAYFSKIR